MENKKRNKPKRRFAGFTDDWEERKVANIAEYSKGNGYSKSDLTEVGTPIILYGRLYTNYQFAIDEVDTFATPKNGAVYSQGNEVLIPASGETAEDIARASAVEKSGVLLGGDLNILWPFDFINPLFLALAISSGEPQKELAKKAQGKSVVHIHNSDIQEVSVSYPLRAEQDQIVAVFRNLDHLITLHQRKLDKLGSIKKSYLSEMFPQEGEKKPKRRFKGFTDDWEKRKLGEIGKSTGGISIESEFSENGIYKVVSIGSYSENSIYNDQGLRAVESDKTRDRVLNKGDITMILNDKTSSGNIIGRVLLIEESGIYVYNQRTERIEINTEKYDSLFIYEMLNAPEIREKIVKQSQGNTQIYVNWSVISSTEYYIPEKEEQMKIGEFFHTLDHLITLHQRKLEKLKNIKQAYLNEMFV